ncbi:MAG: trigger factor [Alphaproteobacteria bacterium]|jgi:trigger factor|nr:trigger factor [Alphaproteobacteria bacterium]MBP9878303.1 trigger factor [Alphaproteobacteria bacterium]
MNIKELKNDGLSKEFEIAVSVDTLLELKQKEITRLTQKVKIDGFRPGKAPVHIVEQRYGAEISSQVFEKSIDKSLREFFEQTKHEPAHQPKIDIVDYKPDQALVYKVAFETMPEIKVSDADFSKLKISKKVAKVEDADVLKALEDIAKNDAKSEPIKTKRAAKSGDIVIINFDGSVDGERKDGMKAESFSLELGSKSFIGDFEEQIVGKKIGDHFDVNVTFPADYHEASLSSKPAVFKIDLLEIHEKTAATIDEEWAKSKGAKSLDEMKTDIRTYLEKMYKDASRTASKKDILDVIAGHFKFPLPLAIVEEEIKSIKDMESKSSNPAHGEEGHVHGPNCNHDHDHEEEEKSKGKKKTAKKLDASAEDKMSDDEIRSIAERRVRLGLLFNEIGKINKIEVTQGELVEALSAQARQYPGYEKQIFEIYRKNEKLIDSLRAPIFENKVIDFILDKSDVKEITVKMDELMSSSE